MKRTKSVERTECSSAESNEKSEESSSSPEKPRGAEPGDVLCYSQGSPHMKIGHSQIAKAKNSTMCNDKDPGNMGSFSAFLPSGYLSPIKRKLSSSFLSFSDSLSVTDSTESTTCSKSGSTSEAYGQVTPNCPYLPVANQIKISVPKMSALREVTEPSSSIFKTGLANSLEEAIVERNSEVVGKLRGSKEESSSPDFKTPKCRSTCQTYSLSRRLTRLLWSPFISCDDESSDEDHLECPPEKPPPPLMCMWRSHVNQIEHEKSVLSASIEFITPGRELNTADKSTQTFVEPAALPLYYSPRGDPDAQRLKEWIDKIFESKISDTDS